MGFCQQGKKALSMGVGSMRDVLVRGGGEEMALESMGRGHLVAMQRGEGFF